MAEVLTEDPALDAILERNRDLPGALLPILHAVQDHYGFIPRPLVPRIARSLNLSRAEVHGVVTYYHHFHETAPRGAVLQICRAEACQALGAHALVLHAQKVLECGFHESSVDGTITLEPVYCLGHCAVGPAIMIGDAVYARVSPPRLDEILETVREGRA